jgi:formate/nitrite transporter FocA (FNT family)
MPPAVNEHNPDLPELDEKQEQEARDRTSVQAVVVHEAIRRDGEDELCRSWSALAWSGFAAGLSMGFSFVGVGILGAHLPDTQWRPLIESLGYPLGFLIVIIGRQQLFTENTLTAVIPLLSERTLGKVFAVLRLWTIVLIANLAGAHLFAWGIAAGPVFSDSVMDTFHRLAMKAVDVTFGAALIRGIFAGWLIAMVVWMNAAVQTGRFIIIVTLTYVVGLSGLTHVVAGATEVLFLAMTGIRSWSSVVTGYILPALLGNILGGVSLVSLLNHAQVIADRQHKH